MLPSSIKPAAKKLKSFIDFKQDRLKDRWRKSTAAYRVLPDFLIIGAQKAGSTFVYDLLLQHRAVLPAYSKELRYFDLKYTYGMDWYRSRFPLKLDCAVRSRLRGYPHLTGEATPDYMGHPRAAEHIFRQFPAMPLIAVLRDPVARAYSHYHYNCRIGLETLSFEDAIHQEPSRLEGEREKMLADPAYRSHAWSHHTYLNKGYYADQLKEFFKYFDRSQILILIAEDVFTNPQQAYDQVTDFLQLARRRLALVRPSNPGHYSSNMSEEMAEELHAHFQAPNQDLYQLIDRELNWE